MSKVQGVDILPSVASRGTLGAEHIRWQAVYTDELYTLDDTNELVDINSLITNALRPASLDIVGLRTAINKLTTDVSNKADREHGVHPPTPLLNEPMKFLRSDNTWAPVTLGMLDAPTTAGVGATGTWGINITGHASTADQATHDGLGQVIDNTYVKKVTYTNNDRLEITRGDGSVYTVYREVTPQKINAPTTAGVGATGTWSINIAGHAASAGTADHAGIADRLNATLAPSRRANVVGLDNDLPIIDNGVYLTSDSGTLHATTFEGTKANLTGLLTGGTANFQGNVEANNFIARAGVQASRVTADLVTAGRFVGNFDGLATRAEVANATTSVVMINDNERKAYVLGQVNNSAYYDTNVYLTTTPGQLHVTSLDASTVTAATFTGALNGRATSAGTADQANRLTITNDSTRQATLLGHVNGTVYADPNVYLTIYSGQLHTTSLQTTSINTYTMSATSSISGSDLTLTAVQPTINFRYNNSNNITHYLRPTSASLLTCSTEFTATKCYNAVWNDYAEFFERGGDDDVRPGDLVALATGDGERYVRATVASSVVVGVCSDEYGHIIGGLPAEPGRSVAETNAGRFVAVALAGRVWTTVRGPVNIGDRIVPSDEPGVGVASADQGLTAVGRAVTAKADDGLGKVRLMVCLGG